jgi:hypothetical protein
MKPHARSLTLVLLVVAGSVAACSSSTPSPRAPQPALMMPSPTETTPRDYPGLHNVVGYHAGFVTGSLPEGDAGFDSLAAMGVKTIVNVDGAPGDVERASARGIRYVHLPIGYNGFDEPRRRELMRAVRDGTRTGGVYLHCHHGKHRAPAAAGAVAVGLGWLTPEAAIERMKIAGTGPNYQGLYACTAAATLVPATEIDAVAADFPAVSKPQGFVKSMLEIDQTADHLKAIEKAGWNPPADHPDLVPAAEAGRLADLHRLLVGGPYAARKPAGFTTMLTATASHAQSLEDMIASGEKDAAKLSERFKIVMASCKECHAKYRD